MESMLGNVGNTGVGVLPDISNLGCHFTNKELDHGGFTGSVLSDTSDTGTEGDLHSDVEKSRRIVYGVGESTLAHLHESLTLGLDTLDRTRLREPHEFILGSNQREERTGGWIRLDIFVEVTLEIAELQVIEREDVATAVVEKTRIVTDNNACHFVERVEVGLDPSNIDDI
jgi:hypothetical protein